MKFFQSLLLLLLLIGPAAVRPAWAAAPEPVDERVKSGLVAYDELRYRRAMELLRRALGDSKLSRADLTASYRTLGLCHIAVGEEEEARQDFRNLLHIDPAAHLDESVAPRIVEMFNSLKSSTTTLDGNPGVSGDPSRTDFKLALSPSTPRRASALSFHISYTAGPGDRLTLFHRIRGATSYQEIDATPAGNGHYSATVPPSDVRQPALEYHVAAIAPSGALIDLAGSEASPLSIAVSPAVEPFYQRPWFWLTLGGVALAAVGVGLGVGLTQHH